MKSLDLAARFAVYHIENPDVYAAFKKFARELKDSGRKRGSASLIFERIRWETAVSGKQEIGLPALKMNNNYRAFYARKLAAENLDFADFFETREQRYEADPISVGDNCVHSGGC